MDRRDLIRAQKALPDLRARWMQRIDRLEQERELAWLDLRLRIHTRYGVPLDAAAIDRLERDIARLGRSILFLDRALLHLDDVRRGTAFATALPLRPS